MSALRWRWESKEPAVDPITGSAALRLVCREVINGVEVFDAWDMTAETLRDFRSAKFRRWVRDRTKAAFARYSEKAAA